MSSALSGLSSIFTGTGGGAAGTLGNISKILGLGSTAYNLYNSYQQNQYQNWLRSMSQDPKKFNAYAQQFVQPLNAGLTSGVANQAQAYLASRGLSSSPQISEQVEAQAIAPYIQQNQNQAYQDALQALGLGGGAKSPNISSSNPLSSLFSTIGNSSNPYQVLLNAQGPTNLSTEQPSLETTIPEMPQVGLQDWFASTVGA